MAKHDKLNAAIDRRKKKRVCVVCGMSFYKASYPHNFANSFGCCCHKCFMSHKLTKDFTCKSCSIKFQASIYSGRWYCIKCEKIAQAEREERQKRRQQERKNGIEILLMMALSDAMNKYPRN